MSHPMAGAVAGGMVIESKLKRSGRMGEGHIWGGVLMEGPTSYTCQQTDMTGSLRRTPTIMAGGFKSIIARACIISGAHLVVSHGRSGRRVARGSLP